MIDSVEVPGAFVVVPRCERLDASQALAFRSDVLPLIAGRPLVILDLRDVAFVDSTGLGCIVAMQKRLTPDGRLRLANVGSRVAALLRLTGLARIFPTYESVEQALAA